MAIALPQTPDQERAFLEAIGEIAYLNPFTPGRLRLEKQLLGDAFVYRDPPLRKLGIEGMDAANMEQLTHACEQMCERLRARHLLRRPTPSQWERYEDLVLFTLFYRYWKRLDRTVTEMHERGAQGATAAFYKQCKAEFDHWLRPDDGATPSISAAHAFACFFHIRRAFFYIQQKLAGSSQPMTQLRAAIWESIFTHDMRRYRRLLYDKLGDVPTLVTGPSGTGKEPVAYAIGMSRYIPFDEKRMVFVDDLRGAILPLNISALSSTLVESELFGHRRGAFTGAVGDRAGWLEVCRPLGTVFLDEVGDLDPAIQVKLLRVLQTRQFNRIGETDDRIFQGKIIAATNVDLGKAIAEDRLREDFYYRLCADTIRTPSLRAVLDDQPDDLRLIVFFLLDRMVGEHVGALLDEVMGVIERDVPRGYGWPGNVRELEQCVRNVLIRRSYKPTAIPSGAADPRQALAQEITAGRLTADQLLTRYCTLVYADSRSYVEAAERLGLDRRTVRARVDEAWLSSLKTM